MRLDDSAPAPAVMLRPRRSKSRLPHFALAALALATTGVGAWLTLRPTPIEARATPLSSSELLAALREQRWPEGRQVPEIYADPELFLLKRHRTAQSYLVNHWNAQNRATKIDLLKQIGEMGSPFAFPLLAEIAYFTLATETDRDIASLLFGALMASTHAYWDVAIYVCDFVNQTAQDDEIGAYAAECSSALLARRQRIGY